MSLTSDIAALSSQLNILIDTFNNKAAAINAQVAAALATIPANTRRAYVDQVNGDDTKDGLSEATAVATFTRAIALAGAGRNLEIRLMSDYTFTQARYRLLPGQDVWVINSLGSEGTPRRKLILNVHPFTEAESGVTGDWEVGGFYLPSTGSTVLHLSGLEIVFPAAPSTGVMIHDRYNGILGGNRNNASAIAALQLNYCTLTRPTGSVGVALGSDTHAAMLFTTSSTYVTGQMAGAWIAGVASGASPASLNWVLSNISSL